MRHLFLTNRAAKKNGAQKKGKDKDGEKNQIFWKKSHSLYKCRTPKPISDMGLLGSKLGSSLSESLQMRWHHLSFAV
jgi:hypothetical protein